MLNSEKADNFLFKRSVEQPPRLNLSTVTGLKNLDRAKGGDSAKMSLKGEFSLYEVINISTALLIKAVFLWDIIEKYLI